MNITYEIDARGADEQRILQQLGPVLARTIEATRGSVRVGRVIEKYQALPFQYGVNDCCKFAAECVEAMTGANPMNGYDYHDRASAMRIIRQHGSLQKLISAVLGPPVSRAAGHGDIVAVTQGRRTIVGVAWREKIILRTSTGLVDWPIDRAEVVWEQS